MSDNMDPFFIDKILANERGIFDYRAFDDYLWSYSQSPNGRDFMRFGPRAIRFKTESVRGLLNATVTNIDTDSEGRIVSGIEVIAPDGG